MLRSALLLVSLIAPIALCGGGKRSLSDELIGTWKLRDTSTEATFRADHTFTIVTDKLHLKGAWRVDGDQLTTTIVTASLATERIETYTISVSRNEFVAYGTHRIIEKFHGYPIEETEETFPRRIYKRVK